MSPGWRPPWRRRGTARPHAIYLAIGFPPAAKSCAYRMRETANQLCAAGWDVTVVTVCRRAWDDDSGLDLSLLDAVDPRVRVVELPLVRADLETDIRRYSHERSLRPRQWVEQWRERSEEIFPEPIFAWWRDDLERALLRVHRRRPADLLVTTCVPYVNLAATWRLWEEHQVPYVVDFRDGWSVDVVGGGEAFPRESVAGVWEQRVLARAVAVWCVNDTIAACYRERYPDIADRVRVVRNGYDADSVPNTVRVPDPSAGLTYGYLGTTTFPTETLEATLTGWRLARRADPLVARSRFEVRGHVGAAALREANRHAQLLREAAPHGVVFGGPVPKGDVAGCYGRWDALVLIQRGGVHMTSGKVYEYMAAGLPVVSAHTSGHGVSAVLAGYPLWTGETGLDPDRLAAAFAAAAKLAVSVSPADRAAAVAYARQFARGPQLQPAVRDVTELVTCGR
ncbi:glycosyltransferase [Luedemannella helvata]|uniref:Glycosyltransferase n=1 Tax=Luedemannella helvata TaxID=349315 RepID=A0ABP4WCG7_9ACTN